MSTKRSRLSIAQAVHRLTAEDLVPLYELKEIAKASEATLRRWIIEGKSGRYLDGFHRPNRGWLSSVPAVLRFLAEVRAVEECPQPQAAAKG